MNGSTPLNDEIFVRSHVPRDLLQNAALFKTDKLVVWEYVSNGLEYVDEGTNPLVKVMLDSKGKKVIIDDAGRGMDWNGLQNFFIMHGENIDRKRGKLGRGRFGTGKSAAFGIANVLRITTVRNGKRSIVELKRHDIEKLNSEGPIPVVLIEREVPTIQPNGTRVEIEQIHLKSLDQSGIIQFIERHLARWKNAVVFVNNRECEYIEPPIAVTREFFSDGEAKTKIGNAKLIIKVAKAPLEEDFRGISIYSNGVWHETTSAGNDGREMANYIFGEIDVPGLDSDQSPIPPFDLSRSMRLNPSNDIVQVIYTFIGLKVDEIRRELVRADKTRRQSEEARKLDAQADEIAKIINEDFYDWRDRIEKVKAKSGRGFDAGLNMLGGMGNDEVIFGSDIPANFKDSVGDVGSIGGSRDGGSKPRELYPEVETFEEASARQGKPVGNQDQVPAKYRGGFKVEFKPMGTDESRAKYISVERTILINLDHPQLVAAKGTNTIEDPTFKKIAYEVAFTEYAIALSAELNSNGNYSEPADPILDIRETINRIARKVAQLYAV